MSFIWTWWVKNSNPNLSSKVQVGLIGARFSLEFSKSLKNHDQTSTLQLLDSYESGVMTHLSVKSEKVQYASQKWKLKVASNGAGECLQRSRHTQKLGSALEHMSCDFSLTDCVSSPNTASLRRKKKHPDMIKERPGEQRAITRPNAGLEMEELCFLPSGLKSLFMSFKKRTPV